jgi:hypothetical protein
LTFNILYQYLVDIYIIKIITTNDWLPGSLEKLTFTDDPKDCLPAGV